MRELIFENYPEHGKFAKFTFQGAESWGTYSDKLRLLFQCLGTCCTIIMNNLSYLWNPLQFTWLQCNVFNKNGGTAWNTKISFNLPERKHTGNGVSTENILSGRLSKSSVFYAVRWSKVS